MYFRCDLPSLDDASLTLFLNVQGILDNEDKALQDILNYLRGQAANGIDGKIDQAVRQDSFAFQIFPDTSYVV